MTPDIFESRLEQLKKENLKFKKIQTEGKNRNLNTQSYLFSNLKQIGYHPETRKFQTKNTPLPSVLIYLFNYILVANGILNLANFPVIAGLIEISGLLIILIAFYLFFQAKRVPSKKDPIEMRNITGMRESQKREEFDAHIALILLVCTYTPHNNKYSGKQIARILRPLIFIETILVLSFLITTQINQSTLIQILFYSLNFPIKIAFIAFSFLLIDSWGINPKNNDDDEDDDNHSISAPVILLNILKHLKEENPPLIWTDIGVLFTGTEGLDLTGVRDYLDANQNILQKYKDINIITISKVKHELNYISHFGFLKKKTAESLLSKRIAIYASQLKVKVQPVIDRFPFSSLYYLFTKFPFRYAEIGGIQGRKKKNIGCIKSVTPASLSLDLIELLSSTIEGLDRHVETQMKFGD